MKKHDLEAQDHDDAEAEEFYRQHGYPHGTPDRAWLEERLTWAERTLVKLSALKAPAIILENQRKLVAQRKDWLAAWDKENVT